MTRIEDYALIGDTQTVALVGRDGSIDWLCLPSFDSAACFASLLGGPEYGRWRLAPANAVRRTSRQYLGDSLVLATEFETDTGTVRVIDFMPLRDRQPDLVRIVEGVTGEVDMAMELIIRFDYGSITPWVQTINGVLNAIGGPDSVSLFTPVEMHGADHTTCAAFTVRAGERIPFHMVWHASHDPVPTPTNALEAVDETRQWWEDWCSHCTYEGPWRSQVRRSLITLKALTYRPTGGIVAAATTSLPEHLGGVRNWDYRFCWLRDATFSLAALMNLGFTDEAVAWRNWLLRTVAGDPNDLQIMYGARGERRLTELELDWLPGYEGSRPVRIGNGAVMQFQLDVYGEVMDALFVARSLGIPPDPAAWALQRHLVRHLETRWHEPDEGIWEVRGPRRHFTHSKMMAWVAFDRAIQSVERFGLEGPVERWRAARQAIHDEICREGYDAERGAFVQSYGSKELDASLLLMPQLGFLPITDARVVGTIRAIERELTWHGFTMRYAMHHGSEDVDGLPPGEGTFLLCSFWLADCYAMMQRHDEAAALFERLVGLSNDVGLLSEQYHPELNRLLGNFPQAFSHVGLINTALRLQHAAAASATIPATTDTIVTRSR